MSPTYVTQPKQTTGSRLCVLCVLLLTACTGTDPLADLKAEIETIRNAPGIALKPPPTFRNYETVLYDANLFRSPFLPPIETVTVKVDIPQGKQVKPDLNRPPEPLETISLDALSMVGTIRKFEGELNALVEDNKGIIRTVRVGNYMGKNHGKIRLIGADNLELVEIIPDGRSGWIERPRTLVLKD